MIIIHYNKSLPHHPLPPLFVHRYFDVYCYICFIYSDIIFLPLYEIILLLLLLNTLLSVDEQGCFYLFIFVIKHNCTTLGPAKIIALFYRLYLKCKIKCPCD